MPLSSRLLLYLLSLLVCLVPKLSRTTALHRDDNRSERGGIMGGALARRRWETSGVYRRGNVRGSQKLERSKVWAGIRRVWVVQL